MRCAYNIALSDFVIIACADSGVLVEISQVQFGAERGQCVQFKFGSNTSIATINRLFFKD